MLLKTYYLQDSKYRIWLVLSAMCIGIFSVAFNTTAVMNALVAIGNDLHLSPTALQWVVNAYLLACASFIVVGGQLGDMLGRRNIFLMGGLWFIISSLLIATVHEPTITIIGRALQGLSAAMITPTTLAIIKVGFPEELQSTAVGFWTATIGLGFAIGPIISGILTSYLSWRVIFWINIPLMLTAMLITRLFVKKSRGAPGSFKLDIWGLILLVFGLIPLTLAIVEGNIFGWTSMFTLFLLIGGIIILIAFWVIEHLVKSPLIHFYHFRERIFVAGGLGMGTSLFALLAILYFFNAFMQNPLLLNYSPVKAGMALLPLSGAMFCLSLLASRITKRFGFRWPIVTALVIIAIACYLLHGLTVHSTYREMWFPLALFGVGMGVSFSSSPALGLSTLPAEKAGEGSGIINTINYYGGILSIAIGAIITMFTGKDALMEILSPTQLSHGKIVKINEAIFGNKGSLEHLEQQLGPTIKHTLHNAIQQSIVVSFSGVMIMCTVVALLAAVVVFILDKK